MEGILYITRLLLLLCYCRVRKVGVRIGVYKRDRNPTDSFLLYYTIHHTILYYPLQYVSLAHQRIHLGNRDGRGVLI